MSANIPPSQLRRDPVVGPGLTVGSVIDKISSIVLTRDVARGWFMLIALSGAGVMMLGISVGWLLIKGVGIWGINEPVAWGFDIINFVWWIGIGHAGTLIS